MSGEHRYVVAVRGGDASRGFQLGGTTTRSARVALVRLRGQALRIADGLDPDPGTWWLGNGGLVRLPDAPEALPDAPAELRAWVVSSVHQDDALDQLVNGFPLVLRVTDRWSGCWFELTARSLVPVPAAPPYRRTAPARPVAYA
ncbi:MULTISPECIES: hypothetical protein [unclassified Streptomyces]|uniref:hypothetical protein n=1 Tax=unclassified Streptomyces TaxID=2593676 RepID=UPI0013CC150F|nr:hypothetical protein [Streptomyces sp. SID11385]NEA44530.1 hypothetical protein [Streptomyces sp. SID11385]